MPVLLARKLCIPLLLLILSIGLFSLPGVVQATWSEDKRVGDIFNACIGVGSVVVSALFSILYYTLNTKIRLINALKGEFIVTNDFVARRLLSREVKIWNHWLVILDYLKG